METDAGSVMGLFFCGGFFLLHRFIHRQDLFSLFCCFSFIFWREQIGDIVCGGEVHTALSGREFCGFCWK